MKKESHHIFLMGLYAGALLSVAGSFLALLATPYITFQYENYPITHLVLFILLTIAVLGAFHKIEKELRP